MNTDKPQTLKGFRDFLPEDAIKRQLVIGKMKQVFEAFGFDPLETPALEYAETLLGKYGDEADKLLFAGSADVEDVGFEVVFSVGVC